MADSQASSPTAEALSTIATNDKEARLFAALRDFDAQGVHLIGVEQPPQTTDWEGVRDRLQRAAAS